MSDVKISQLPSTTTLNNTDLIPISQSMGGGNWQSKSITALNIMHAFTNARTISVSKTGARDADTIKDAIAIAVSMSPTEFNPVTIQVYPGAYIEDNPINIPQWVSLYSEGGQYGAGVVASNDGDIFIGNGNSSLDGFSIIGMPLFSNVAYQSVGTLVSIIENCILINCWTGILSDNGSLVANYVTGLSYAGTPDKFLGSVNGGFLTATSCSVTGISASPNNAYYCSDAGSELYLFSCAASNCVNGIYANKGGYIDALSNHYNGCTNSIRIGPIGASNIKCLGSIIESSVTNDIFVESITASLGYFGRVDSSKFAIVNGATVTVVANDVNFGGALIVGQSSLQGKVSVGTPGALFLQEDMQLNVGEGSSFVNDKQGNPIVEYWAYDASAPSSSKFTRFVNNAGTQLANSNDALYVGCKYPFPAIRLDVDVAAVLGASYFTTEYWNGHIWVDLTARLPGGGVATYKRSTFTPHANKIFQDVENQFVEFSAVLFSSGNWTAANNVLNEIPLWNANEPFYAIRFRNNGAITSGMQFKSGRVKPHGFMVSTSGQKANFGLYRTDKNLYIDSITLYSDPTWPPTMVDVQVSTNIGYKNVPSCLRSVSHSRVATEFAIPSDIDTSSPLYIYIDGVATTAATGNIHSWLYRARVDITAPPLPLPISEVSVDQVTAVPGVANSFLTIEQDLDISGFNVGDLIFLAFERDTTDLSLDTYTGDFLVADITLEYKVKFV